MILNKLYSEIADTLSKYTNQEITPAIKKKINKEVNAVLKPYILANPNYIDYDSIDYEINKNTISINIKGLLLASVENKDVK